MTTYTAPSNPILHISACGCCLTHGEDMIFSTGTPVLCVLCGSPCTCPGCEAEVDPPEGEKP